MTSLISFVLFYFIIELLSVFFRGNDKYQQSRVNNIARSSLKNIFLLTIYLPAELCPINLILICSRLKV